MRSAFAHVARAVPALLLVLAASACCETKIVYVTPDGGEPALAVQIGMRKGPRDNTFVPLEPGGDIHLGTFGQGGTHAELGVRCIGFGNRAFINLTLENLHEEGKVIMHPPSSRPQLLRCVEEPAGACDYLPIYFMTGGLADPADKDGLPVLVRASCLNEEGELGVTSVNGVLRADEEAAAVGREDAGPGDDEDAGTARL